MENANTKIAKRKEVKIKDSSTTNLFRHLNKHHSHLITPNTQKIEDMLFQEQVSI